MDRVKRGEIILVAAPGDYGKPRPAVVIQSESLGECDSVLVCLVTSSLREAPIYRLDVPPLPGNDLRLPSQIMVDKISAVPRGKCGATIGRLDNEALVSLNRMLALAIGIADT